MELRIQKIMSQCGICSRREAEQWILRGKVIVNGRRVTELGAKADPHVDDIRVGGKRIGFARKSELFLWHKPTGVVTTMTDTKAAPGLQSVLPKKLLVERIVPLGRLEKQSAGLLLLSTDPTLVDLWAKKPPVSVYEIKVRGMLKPKTIKRIERGAIVSEQKAYPMKVKIVEVMETTTRILLETNDPRPRIIREAFSMFGNPISKMKRVRLGSVTLGNLPPGEFRQLTDEELRRVYKSAQLKPFSLSESSPSFSERRA
jgi:23S rRNA pseudouridine2605 synthase